MGHVEPHLAFGHAWFRRHQRELLLLANHPLTRDWFRYVLRIHEDVGRDETIVQIEPNNYKVLLDMDLKNDEVKIRADFRAHNKFSKRIYHAFSAIWWAMHIWDWLVGDRFAVPALSFGMSSLLAYPAQGANSPCDGYVYRQSTNESWTSLRNGVGTGKDVHSAIGYIMAIISGSEQDSWAGLYRSIFMFDTSSIGASASISDADLQIKGFEKQDNLLISPGINVYQATPAATNNLSPSDFGQIGTTAFSDPISFSAFDVGIYNNFDLNAAGTANINKTGISKFGLRNSNYDVSGVAPNWSETLSSYMTGYFVDVTGTNKDPRLIVVYTTGPAMAVIVHHLKEQGII